MVPCEATECRNEGHHGVAIGQLAQPHGHSAKVGLCRVEKILRADDPGQGRKPCGSLKRKHYGVI